MVCPNCQAECLESDEFCKACGSDLATSSTSLVPARSHSNLPTILQRPQLPRLAAGVGAVAFGLGLELLRRALMDRATKAALHAAPKLLPSPAIGGLSESLMPQHLKTPKLPKGYEIEETAIYVSRVIRRRK
jgi:hypothetical protein